MTFDELLSQVVDLLQRQGRVSSDEEKIMNSRRFCSDRHALRGLPFTREEGFGYGLMSTLIRKRE